jgi:RHH-type transcriptional regulator, proline utilization regulon repressor / proline dehydrogenase / delta 1-pyrroline-5-carboxylate dehydrogenase
LDGAVTAAREHGVAGTDDGDPDGDLVERTVALARAMMDEADRSTSRSERRRSERLGRLLADAQGRAFLLALTDEVLRAATPHGRVRRLAGLAEQPPRALGMLDRIGLRAGAVAGRWSPRLVAELVERRVRHETSGLIVRAEEPALTRHLARRRRDDMATNVNPLGEAILSDDEADRRFAQLLRYAARDDVGYVSVKVSSIVAGIDVVAFEHDVERIAARLAELYAHARRHRVFVNLDMEEVRDLALTVAAFTAALDEPELVDVDAGIVLQAYLPDSHGAARQLCEWAVRRRAAGGGRLKVRVVKGANLAMELVEAELAGWPAAPYPTKADVDASYKLLLDELLECGRDARVRVGVATHNVFDVAWALTRRAVDPDADRIELEMLEGMAPALARTARRHAGHLLLYTPIVRDDEYEASLAYLARRLDENASPENFLHALLTASTGRDVIDGEAARFRRSVVDRHAVATTPRRTMDRTAAAPPTDPTALAAPSGFVNEPDTDFTIAVNRDWVRAALADYRQTEPPAIATTTADIDAAVARAVRGASDWAATTVAMRRAVLAAAADVAAAERGSTIALMSHTAAKTVREGDVEVSEAIDFARYAAATAGLLDELAADGLDVAPAGVVLVAAPWNFPYAIPWGGVVGALAAGNAVLLKPAPEAVDAGARIVDQLHRAGVPADVVRLVVCPDGDVGLSLVTHPDVDRVVLTGSIETARMFLDRARRLHLTAETSGKNAIVVTASADLDDAIRDIVRSAFGHAGQKCSAASLVIAEDEVLDHTTFLPRLAAAVRSLRVGPATDVATQMGPLITPPGEKLRRGLTALEAGERWIVEPRPLDGSGRLWSPGLRAGVAPGSWFHVTECFGPVLGVMRAADLTEAIELQNGTPFGLTAGLHALDPGEIEQWIDAVRAGNLYVNRHITGAIVQRQPFGGWKASRVGDGPKPGGPDWVRSFADVGRGRWRPDPTSIEHWWRTWFSREHDPTGLRAESNVLRYRPLDGVVVRHDAGDAGDGIALATLRRAAELTGTPVTWSGPDESEEALVRRLASSGAERLRVVAPCGDGLLAAAHAAGVAVDTTPVTGHGRIELPCWLKEQAVSRTMHRHGRLV